MRLERRKKERCELICGVSFAYDQSAYLIGKIKTLSESGLSFQYAGSEARTASPMQIDILCSHCELTSLARLTCRNVYDIKELVERQSYRGVDVRLCGVEFIGLSRAQQSDIIQLIAIESSGNCKALDDVSAR